LSPDEIRVQNVKTAKILVLKILPVSGLVPRIWQEFSRKLLILKINDLRNSGAARYDPRPENAHKER
jgi:hypothetical protein